MPHLRPPALIVATALGVLFVLLLVYASFMPKPESVPGPLDQKRLIAMEDDKVRAALNDPDSAKFRNETVSTLKPIAVVCGEVNFKSELGGYVGYQRFISGSAILLIERAIDREEMNELWGELCAAPSR